jgi:diamine N-acetyltransferase
MMNTKISPYTITEANMEDVEELSALGRETFVKKFSHLYRDEDLKAFLDTKHSSAHYKEAIRDKATKVWIAKKKESNMVGYAVAGPLSLPVETPPPEALELKRLYISNKDQSKGLGAQFMGRFFQWTKKMGDPSVFLGVYSDNHEAQRFYARFGFLRVGKYYLPVGEHMDLEFILEKPRG